MRHAEIKLRQERVRALVLEGISVQAIAERLGMRIYRVREIAMALGVEPEHGKRTELLGTHDMRQAKAPGGVFNGRRQAL